MPVVFYVDPKIREDKDTKAHRRDHLELHILPGGKAGNGSLEAGKHTRKAAHGRYEEPRLSSGRSRSWPLIGSISAFFLFGGAVMWMHDNRLRPVRHRRGLHRRDRHHVQWWSNTIREAHTGYHTPVVQLHLRYGMILFIASEVMFFLAWFWAYFDASLFPSAAKRSADSGRPRAARPRPVGIPASQHLDPALLGNDGDLGAPFADPRRPRGPEARPVLTILLGLLFTSIQAYEYIHAPFAFKQSAAATSTVRPSSWRPASTAST